MTSDTFKSYRHADSTTVTEHHDLEASDRLRRRIGTNVSRCTVTTARVMRYTDTGEGVPVGTDLNAQPRRPWDYHQEATPPAYGWAPHATRNGAIYGASQPWAWFDTEAEREADVARYLASARKRAAKAQRDSLARP